MKELQLRDYLLLMASTQNKQKTKKQIDKNNKQ
jgi:hypothetical protein